MAEKTVSSESGKTLSTLKNLWPYMWPHERPDLKRLVVWAAFYLVLAKLLTLAIPYTFKWATDVLNGTPIAGVALPAILLGPVALVIAYNIARIVSTGLNQLREQVAGDACV